MSQIYLIIVNNDNKGFLYNLFNRWSNVSQGLQGMFLSNSLYHGGAFIGVLRFIFTFIMPSLLLGAIPVEIVKNLSITNLIIIVLLTIFWFIIAVLFFNKSLKKYESNNLFGFGS